MRALADCLRRCRELGVAPTRFIFAARVASQNATVFEQIQIRTWPAPCAAGPESTPNKNAPKDPPYQSIRECRISTSKFGSGQVTGSNQTPLGLHRIAEKYGDGCPAGTVFKARQAIGHLNDGLPLESITTRILWLEGLEEGWNRGGNVDTHARYIYIHGFGDQDSLGTPASLGCIHLADADLIPLYDLLPGGTLVWIER